LGDYDLSWDLACFHIDIHRVCTNVRTARRRLRQLSGNCEANRDASNRGLGVQASPRYSPYRTACPLDMDEEFAFRTDAGR
jgi:hypothetical protein